MQAMRRQKRLVPYSIAKENLLFVIERSFYFNKLDDEDEVLTKECYKLLVNFFYFLSVLYFCICLYKIAQLNR